MGLLELFGVSGKDGDVGTIRGNSAGESKVDAVGVANDEHVVALIGILTRWGLMRK